MAGTVSPPSDSRLKFSQTCWQFEHADNKTFQKPDKFSVAHAFNNCEGEMTFLQIKKFKIF